MLLQARTGIDWYRCGTSHAIFTCLASGVRKINSTFNRSFLRMRCKKCISEGVRFNATHINCILTVFLSVASIFFICQNHDKVQQEK